MISCASPRGGSEARELASVALGKRAAPLLLQGCECRQGLLLVEKVCHGIANDRCCGGSSEAAMLDDAADRVAGLAAGRRQ